MSDKTQEFRAFVAFEKGAATVTGEFVRGWLSVTHDENGKQVVDGADDRISIVELTKAAHRFVSSTSRSGRVMHNGVDVGEFVESVIIDDDFAKAVGMTSKKRGWWGNFHVLDADIRKQAAAGKFKGFSIGGRGLRITKKV